MTLVVEEKHEVQRVTDFAPIRRNRLLSLLPPSDYGLLAPALVEVPLARGAVLHDGERGTHVYFPHSGVVSLVCGSPREQGVETACVGREGAICIDYGLGASTPSYRAIVQVPGTAARVSASRFADAVSQSETLREIVLAQQSLLLRQTQQNVLCGAAHLVRARVCRWLSHARDRCGDTLPLKQEVISQALGVQRTTVTLILRMLQDEGLIRTLRGRVVILNAAALQAQTCDCYDIVADSMLQEATSPPVSAHAS